MKFNFVTTLFFAKSLLVNNRFLSEIVFESIYGFILTLRYGRRGVYASYLNI
jgi:hypothetical protein